MTEAPPARKLAPMDDWNTESIGRAYREHGYVAPITAMSPAGAGECRRELEAVEQANDPEFIKGVLLSSSQFVLQFAYDLIHNGKIVDAVRAVLGDDVMCWRAGFFIKEPGDAKFVSWHQDLHYWGLEGGEEVTAWLALSPSTPESGCMRVVPGTHRVDRAKHRDTWADDNLLSRGQAIEAVDETQAVDLVLQPGQFSLHHGKTFHGSRPNTSNDRRIGYAIRYITPNMRQTVAEKDWACLVAGRDRFGHFESFPRPAGNLDPADMALRQTTLDVESQATYR
ncbi:MAG: phytanoyl-CoA dioxygenase family protein [Pseudomonadota bacterium]